MINRRVNMFASCHIECARAKNVPSSDFLSVSSRPFLFSRRLQIRNRVTPSGNHFVALDRSFSSTISCSEPTTSRSVRRARRSRTALPRVSRDELFCTQTRSLFIDRFTGVFHFVVFDLRDSAIRRCLDYGERNGCR